MGDISLPWRIAIVGMLALFVGLMVLPVYWAAVEHSSSCPQHSSWDMSDKRYSQW